MARNCPQCGVMSAEGVTFCERCGYKLKGDLPKPVQEELYHSSQQMPTWYLVSGLVFLIFGFILLGIAWGSFIDDTSNTDPFADPQTDWPNIPTGLIIGSILLIAIGGLLLAWSIVRMASDAI